MTEFSTYQAFQIFRRHVLRESRYVLDDVAQSFLKTVLATSGGRRREFPEGRNFWRAQEGHGWEKIQQNDDEFEVPGPLSQVRMRPLPHAAIEGRANPKGIPCLYLATDKETAMAEVRPSVGTYVSVGQFKTLRPLTLLDCYVGHNSGFNLYFKEPDVEERERAVWNDIDRAFSEPVTVSDSTADYASTQILSEVFKREGYDGVAYKSNLGPSFNLALFDLNAADIINCFLYRVKSVVFEFDEAANPYFVQKYYEQKAKSGQHDV